MTKNIENYQTIDATMANTFGKIVSKSLNIARAKKELAGALVAKGFLPGHLYESKEKSEIARPAFYAEMYVAGAMAMPKADRNLVLMGDPKADIPDELPAVLGDKAHRTAAAKKAAELELTAERAEVASRGVQRDLGNFRGQMATACKAAGINPETGELAPNSDSESKEKEAGAPRTGGRTSSEQAKLNKIGDVAKWIEAQIKEETYLDGKGKAARSALAALQQAQKAFTEAFIKSE